VLNVDEELSPALVHEEVDDAGNSKRIAPVRLIETT